MAEWTNTVEQIVNPGESVIFTINSVPCTRGFVRNRAGDGNFVLSGWVPNSRCGCCCHRADSSAIYFVDFGANIAIPTGGEVGEISLAFAIDGSTIPSTSMVVTPAAVEEYSNVSRATNIPIWRNCCQSVSVRNTSDQPILVRNANIDFSRPDLEISM